jgi:hypothetical protein
MRSTARQVPKRRKGADLGAGRGSGYRPAREARQAERQPVPGRLAGLVGLHGVKERELVSRDAALGSRTWKRCVVLTVRSRGAT